MSVADLYSAFVTAAERGRIDGSILPLMGKLVATLGVEVLLVEDPAATRLPDAARLTGSTAWPPPAPELEEPPKPSLWNLTLLGTVDEQGHDLLTLELRARGERGFVALGSVVPDLPHSRIPDPGVGGGIIRADSVLAELGPEEALLTATAADDGDEEAPPPRLSGWLVLDAPAFVWTQGLLGTSRLALAGVIDPRAGAAIADKVRLEATAPLASTDWTAKLDVQSVFLRLTTDSPDIYSLISSAIRCSAVRIVLSVQVRTPEAHVVEVSVDPWISSRLWDFSGSADPPLTLSDGIVGLLSLFPGASPETFALPAGLAPLDAFGVSSFRFGVETQTQAVGSVSVPYPTGIAYTGLALESTSSWDLPVPYLSMEQVGASWLVWWNRPTDSWSGSLYGTMRFGPEPSEGDGDGSDDDGDGGDERSKVEAAKDTVSGAVELDVNVSLPDLAVDVRSRHPFAMKLPTAMAQFFPGEQPEVGSGLIVAALNMNASLYGKAFNAGLKVLGHWPVRVGNVLFQLEEIEFGVTSRPSLTWGSLTGIAGLYTVRPPSAKEARAAHAEPDDDPDLPDQKLMGQLSVSAIYPGDGSWEFEGGLASTSLDLLEFALAFRGQAPPPWLTALNVQLTRLWAKYSTAPHNPYSASAAVAVHWNPDLLGLSLSLVAAADFVYRERIRDDTPAAGHDALLPSASAADDADMVYEGSVVGAFRVNNLTVTAGLSFLAHEETWLFRIQLDRFLLEGSSAWTGSGDARHQVIRVEMQGVTLGEMIASFAALANPNANYQLSEPWTFLNDIHLGHFTLLVDPTEQRVSLDYAIRLRLAFITIESVGVRYDRSSGEPQVNIEITGSFLGKQYGNEPGQEPLGWDALNDSPPEVPGGGTSLVRLGYLGLGQHVNLDGLAHPDSVADVIRLMREQMRPMQLANRNPLDQPSGSELHFDEGVEWLIGMDLTVMDTARIQLVLRDPNLYGALITLDGPQAGALAGFLFELLYKKVTPELGLFHARLQVPKRFRQLNFGTVALTLGTITVDVYTNGNFKADFGFPHGGNFSHSFGLRYGAFTGKGGIYFGVLDGSTSSQVPAIRNGTFAPVLELGVGLSVTAGRQIKQGMLQAGLTVQLVVLFEGVLAWFHPDDASAPQAMYYSARGSASLAGHLYGKVKFKVASVNVTVDASASMSLTLAAYRKTAIRLKLNVRAYAKVKVGFVKVSCSFKLDLNASFDVGRDSTTPWVLGSGKSKGRGSGSQHRLAGPVAVHAGTPPLPNASRGAGRGRLRGQGDLARLLRGMARAPQLLAAESLLVAELDPCAAYRLDFSPAVQVFGPGDIRSLDVRMLPAFSAADLPLVWPDQPDAPDPQPAYQVVMLLTIDGPGVLAAETLEEARHGPFVPTARAGSAGETPFATLAEAMFRWAVSALGLDPQSAVLDAGQLADLAAQLDCPQTFAEGFAFSNLSEFLGNNLCLRISGPPQGRAPDELAGVVFPMPPVLGWRGGDPGEPGEARNFAAYQPVDDAYAARVAATFRRLSPDPLAPEELPQEGGILPGESLASVVFRDYLLLITKAMVQTATQLFAAFPVELQENSTLNGIAAGFSSVTVPYLVREGDTLDQVASHYGYSPEELLALNPALPETLAEAEPTQRLEVVLGVTPESIAAANPQQLLAAEQSLAVPALETQVLAGETPAQLCARLGAAVDAWLQGPAALDAPTILRSGAVLALTDASFANPGNLDLDQIAALTYVRYQVGTQAVTLAPRVNWYAEAIVGLNEEAIGADGSLPARVNLPAAFNPPPDSPPVVWQRLAGDTLGRLAAFAALWQNPQADPAYAAWLAQVEAANPDFAGGVARIPDAEVQLQPDESLRALAARLLQVLLVQHATAEDAEPNAAFRELVAAAPVLEPLAPAVVTDCLLTTDDAQTVQGFATHYDLPLETVGRIGADVPGWFAPGGEPLVVPHLAAASLDQLMPRLLGDARVRDVAGQASRFTLHGQRLPTPEQPEVFAGLYELLGQQLPGPAPQPGTDPATPRLVLEVAPTVPTEWIVLVDSEAASVAGDVAAALADYTQRVPEFARHNPVAAGGSLRPGMLLDLGARADQTLSIVITEAMLAAGYPAASVQPVLTRLPAPLQLYRDVPLRHGLPRQILWNTPQRPTLPDSGPPLPAVGMPSFWPFPRGLRNIAAEDDSRAWSLERVDITLGPEAAPVPVTQYTWATLVGIRVQRIPGDAQLLEVLGADLTDRPSLLALWEYLAAQAGQDDATLSFAFARSPAAGLAAGLSSYALDREASYVVRTNLSHETSSGGGSALARTRAEGGGGAERFFASMAQAGAFLRLLWEASVVGGRGYWLRLTDDQGQGLPADLFDGDGVAVLRLAAVLASQTGADPDRRFHRFTTAALVGAPLDASSSLFVVAADGSETVRQATVAPGNVGFTLGLKNPSDLDVSVDARTRRLFNLAGYQLPGAEGFAPSTPGLPVSPQVAEAGDDDDQTIFQVVPIHRYARSCLPREPGMPPPEEDPYAGIAAQGTSPASVPVLLSFHDVFGNCTAAADS